MTLDLSAAALDMRSAHHLAATARRHGNVAAWRKWDRIFHAIRGQIDTGRTDLGGGPFAQDLSPTAGDLDATSAGVASPPPNLATAPHTAPDGFLRRVGLSVPVDPSLCGGPSTGRESNGRNGEPGGRVAHDASAVIAQNSTPRPLHTGRGA